MNRLLLVALLLLLPLTALATEEICGDGIDNDSSGGDAACASPDADRDGYTTNGTGEGYDCDDSNRYIYPGVDTVCTVDTANDGWKTCQSDGTYTACTKHSVTPRCAATGGGSCYYINASTGNNANAGTYAAPWADQRNIVTYYQVGDRPAGWVDIAAGSVVYLMDGTYTYTYTYNGNRKAFYWRNENGTSGNKNRLLAYPGQNSVVINPDANCNGSADANNCSAVEFETSDYWVVGGHGTGFLTLTGAYGSEGGGIKSDADYGEVYNAKIYDNDGKASDNVSGINVSISPTGWNIHHNLIYGNYDRANNTAENNSQVVLFQGDANNINYNVIYGDPSTKRTNCFKYKHGSTGTTQTVKGNVFFNCDTAAGWGTSGLTFTKNFVLDSDHCTWLKDWGGTSYFSGAVIQYNTFKNCKGNFYDPDTGSGSIGQYTYRYNVFSDNSASQGNELGPQVVHTYGSDTLYTDAHSGGKLTINNNCYYNSATSPQFCLFCANGGAYGSNGALYSYANWQGTAGYDGASYNENPTLDSQHRATATNCDDWGWRLTSEESGGGGGGGGAAVQQMNNKNRSYGFRIKR